MVCDNSLCPFDILEVNNHLFLFAVLISRQIHCSNVHCLLIHNSNPEDNEALLCSFSWKHSSWSCLFFWFALLCVISRPATQMSAWSFLPLSWVRVFVSWSFCLSLQFVSLLFWQSDHDSWQRIQRKNYLIKHMSNKTLFVRWQWCYLYNSSLYTFPSELWRHAFSLISKFQCCTAKHNVILFLHYLYGYWLIFILHRKKIITV